MEPVPFVPVPPSVVLQNVMPTLVLLVMVQSVNGPPVPVLAPDGMVTRIVAVVPQRLLTERVSVPPLFTHATTPVMVMVASLVREMITWSPSENVVRALPPAMAQILSTPLPTL